MAKAFNPTIDFTDSPTLCRFIADGEKIIDSDEQLLTPHFVRAVLGPFGSGKSTALAAMIRGGL